MNDCPCCHHVTSFQDLKFWVKAKFFFPAEPPSSMNLAEICDNAKKGREYALLGNYDSSMVYYEGVIQQIHKYCQSLRDPALKVKWQQVKQELSEEYEQVKGIVGTLESFKSEKPVDFSAALPVPDERPQDPAVWPPPIPAEHRYVLCHLSDVGEPSSSTRLTLYKTLPCSSLQISSCIPVHRCVVPTAVCVVFHLLCLGTCFCLV